MNSKFASKLQSNFYASIGSNIALRSSVNGDESEANTPKRGLSSLHHSQLSEEGVEAVNVA